LQTTLKSELFEPLITVVLSLLIGMSPFINGAFAQEIKSTLKNDNSTSDIILKNGRVLKNAKVESIKGNTVTISHSAGVGNFRLKDLPDESSLNVKKDCEISESIPVKFPPPKEISLSVIVTKENAVDTTLSNEYVVDNLENVITSDELDKFKAEIARKAGQILKKAQIGVTDNDGKQHDATLRIAINAYKIKHVSSGIVQQGYDRVVVDISKRGRITFDYSIKGTMTFDIAGRKYSAELVAGAAYKRRIRFDVLSPVADSGLASSMSRLMYELWDIPETDLLMESLKERESYYYEDAGNRLRIISEPTYLYKNYFRGINEQTISFLMWHLEQSPNVKPEKLNAIAQKNWPCFEFYPQHSNLTAKDMSTIQNIQKEHKRKMSLEFRDPQLIPALCNVFRLSCLEETISIDRDVIGKQKMLSTPFSELIVRLKDPRAVEILSVILDENIQSPELVVKVLGKLGDTRAVPALEKRLKKGREIEEVLTALSLIGDAASVSCILHAIMDKSLEGFSPSSGSHGLFKAKGRDYVGFAWSRIGEINNPAISDVLSRMLEATKDEEIRRNLSYNLERLKKIEGF